jgi:glycosyltransferase involved in cell wall biosynthesis
MPKVSVIIPTFNRLEYLPRSLGSVLAQSYDDYELIVVDDGSTDQTIDAIQQDYPSVNLIVQQNKGVSAARNAGIQEASGEWIALLDSDDEWLPEKLNLQMKALESHPEYRSCHTEEIWIRDGHRVNPIKKYAKFGGQIFKRCLPLCIISPSSVVLHRELLQEVGGFDETLDVCEDYDLWLRVTAREPVLFLDQPLVKKYGGHDDQLSTMHWGMDRFRVRALQRVLDEELVSGDDEHMTLQTLVGKLDLLIKGSRKRGNLDLLHELEPQLKAARENLNAKFS